MTEAVKAKREERQFWATTKQGAIYVTGYSCGPDHPRYWYCPRPGYTGREGEHLFTNKALALDRVIADLAKQIADKNLLLDQLLQERRQL